MNYFYSILILLTFGFLAGVGFERLRSRTIKKQLAVALAATKQMGLEIKRQQQWIDDTQEEFAKGKWEMT
jgi:hypothetical protein